MLSSSTIISLDVNVSSTTLLNNLLFHHYFHHSIRDEMEFGNFKMLGLEVNE